MTDRTPHLVIASSVAWLPDLLQHAVPLELELILWIVDVRLKVDDDHLRRGKRLPAVHNHRRDLDQAWPLAAEEDRVHMPERWRVGPDVAQRQLELAGGDGEMVGVAYVQVPAFDEAVGAVAVGD